MADNIVIRDGAGNAVTMRTTEAGGAHSPHHVIAPWRMTLTDRSGTIAQAGIAQEAAGENVTRSYLIIQNVSQGDLWVNFGVAAVAGQPSLLLVPGAMMEWAFLVPTAAVSVLAAEAGLAYTCKEA